MWWQQDCQFGPLWEGVPENACGHGTKEVTKREYLSKRLGDFHVACLVPSKKAVFSCLRAQEPVLGLSQLVSDGGRQAQFVARADLKTSETSRGLCVVVRNLEASRASCYLSNSRIGGIDGGR